MPCARSVLLLAVLAAALAGATVRANEMHMKAQDIYKTIKNKKWADPARHVQPLTENNFERLTAGAEQAAGSIGWLVLFADDARCDTCLAAGLHFDVLAGDRAHHMASLGAVDCARQGKTCARFGVSTFPTVVFIGAGARMTAYAGDTNHREMKDWLVAGRLALPTAAVPHVWVGDVRFFADSALAALDEQRRRSPRKFYGWATVALAAFFCVRAALSACCGRAPAVAFKKND
jgi:hypothetical protein